MTTDRNSDAPELDPAGEEGYQRGLNPRTMQMIAIGGAIGTGLFYGAGGAIEQAGPALILAYLVAGLAIFVIMRALGELLIYRPVSGIDSRVRPRVPRQVRSDSPTAGPTGRCG